MSPLFSQETKRCGECRTCQNPSWKKRCLQAKGASWVLPTAATSSTADVTEHTQAHHISPDDFFREISGEIDSEVGEPATSSAADVAEHVEASRTLKFAVATSGFSRDLNLEVREPAATADASIA